MWYYDRLHFLAGQTEPRPALSSLPSTLPSPPAEASDAQPGPSRQQHVEEPRLSQGSLSQEVAGPSRLPDLQVPPLHLERESGRRRSALEEAAVGLFWRVTEALGAPHTVEDDFAAIIASKMQRMEEGQQLMSESLILEALNKGMRDQITSDTHLCELTHGSRPPPPAGPPPPSPPGPPSPPPPPGPTPPPATSPTAESQPGRKRGRPESEDPGSSLVGQKMQPLVVPQPGDADVICCFPDLWEFWTRLPSLTYGLLRPPILLFKN
ncbi:hypothetical protein AB205_0066350 [Aquarana catesbeiana]|uniref:Uncharacterized protein n=1 Tax=Aquarana catesbeiana TaxID=8400 RepID=A0A2G9SD18_AQUCT|nr:hypothetical protein AB205_0066350 [Aquarana catesbeiana]